MVALAALWGASYMFIKHRARRRRVRARHRLRADRARRAGAAARRARRAAPACAAHWRAVALLGLVQVAAPFLLITFGERRIPSSLAGDPRRRARRSSSRCSRRSSNREESARAAGRVVGIVVGISASSLLFGVDLSGEGELALGGAMVLLAAPRLRDRRAGAARLAGRRRPSRRRRNDDRRAAGRRCRRRSPSRPGDAEPRHAPRRCSCSAPAARASPSSLLQLIAEVGAGPRVDRRVHRARLCGPLRRRSSSASRSPLGTVAGLALILGGSWLAAEGRLPGANGPRRAARAGRRGLLSRSGPCRSSARGPARAR